MPKPRSEKKRQSEHPGEQRVQPMQLQVGDRIVDETGEYAGVGRPYTTAAGKNARVRVRRVDNPDVTMIRIWGAHERVSVRRPRRSPIRGALVDVISGTAAVAL
jgi:hypothetical protein